MVMISPTVLMEHLQPLLILEHFQLSYLCPIFVGLYFRYLKPCSSCTIIAFFLPRRVKKGLLIKISFSLRTTLAQLNSARMKKYFRKIERIFWDILFHLYRNSWYTSASWLCWYLCKTMIPPLVLIWHLQFNLLILEHFQKIASFSFWVVYALRYLKPYSSSTIWELLAPMRLLKGLLIKISFSRKTTSSIFQSSTSAKIIEFFKTYLLRLKCRMTMLTKFIDNSIM